MKLLAIDRLADAPFKEKKCLRRKPRDGGAPVRSANDANTGHLSVGSWLLVENQLRSRQRGIVFDRVIIDRRSDPKGIFALEAELTPALYLVSDLVVELERAPVFEPGLMNDGSRPAPPSASNGYRVVTDTLSIQRFLKYGIKEGTPIFTSDLYLRAAVVRQDLNVSRAVLALAAAGVNVSVPSVKKLKDQSRTQLVQLREKVAEERKAYLDAVAGYARESYDRLLSGYSRDVVRWALNEAALKIHPQAQKLTHAVQSTEKRTLKSIVGTIVAEVIPALGSSLHSCDATVILNALLRITSKLGGERISAGRARQGPPPEFVYLLKLQEEIG